MSLLDKISSPDVRLFFQAWHALYLECGDIPRRTFVDPLAFVRALPKVWLYERQSNGIFLNLLSGEEIRTCWGVRMKGRPLSEIIPLGGHKLVEQRFSILLDEPCIIHGFNVTQTKHYSYAERLFAPLADNSGVPVYIFGISDYNRSFSNELDRYKEIVKNFEVFGYDLNSLEVIKKFSYD